MPFYRFQSIFVVLLLASLTLIPAESAFAESWTSLSGGRTVEARLIGLWADSVILEMEDGRRVTVRLSDLIAESRIQARKLAEEQVRSRATMVGEYRAQADEAAAPAPNPLPKPPPASPYVQPKANAAIIEQLVLVDDQSRSGHILAGFDSLPPSYRKDISDLAKIAATKINVDSWQSLMGSLHAIGDVIVTKQRWVFSHPRLEAMPPESLEPIEEILLLVAGLLREGLDPQAMNLDTLKTTPLRDWLAARDAAMAPYLAQLNDYGPRQSFELVSEQNGVANVKVSLGDATVTLPYTAVEGFWVPKQFVDNWPNWMEQARAQLEATPDGTFMTDPVTTMIPTMIKPIIDPLVAADEKSAFHAAMENMFAQAAPMATLAGVDLSGKSRRGGDSEYSGYEDYDMEMGREEMETEDYSEQMEEMERERSGANPNIGARLEDTLRSRSGQ